MAAELAERVGQAAVIGEILAGLILGPALLGLITVAGVRRHRRHRPTCSPRAAVAGMEIDLDQLFDAFRGRNLDLDHGICGAVRPWHSTGATLGLDAYSAIFVGLCIAITALPVSIRILMDIGRLLDRHRFSGTVGAAIANDVIALLVLGVIVNANRTQAGWPRSSLPRGCPPRKSSSSWLQSCSPARPSTRPPRWHISISGARPSAVACE